MKFCRFMFRNCSGSVLKPFGTLRVSVGDVFWNFQSSRHQGHNSNIFKFDRISWVKSKNPSTPITNLLKLFWLTHLVFSGNPLVGFKIEWPRTAVLTCFLLLLTVRCGLAIINCAVRKHRLGPRVRYLPAEVRLSHAQTVFDRDFGPYIYLISPIWVWSRPSTKLLNTMPN